jgi:hypothetical protein
LTTSPDVEQPCSIRRRRSPGTFNHREKFMRVPKFIVPVAETIRQHVPSSAKVKAAVVGAAAAPGLMLAGPAEAAQAAAPVSRSGIAETGVVESSSAAARVCTFETRGDNPHNSGSDASVHGWWTNGDCPTQWADVTVQLQAKIDNQWVNVGRSGMNRVRSSTGGRGRRVTARAECWTSQNTLMRGVVDVDLVDIIDDPYRRISDEVVVGCRPKV